MKEMTTTEYYEDDYDWSHSYDDDDVCDDKNDIVNNNTHRRYSTSTILDNNVLNDLSENTVLLLEE